MAESPYYLDILADAPSEDPRYGQAKLLYTQLIQFFRAGYDNNKTDKELQMIEDFKTTGTTGTTGSKLRSPYEDNSKDGYVVTSAFGPRFASWKTPGKQIQFHAGVDLGHKSGVKSVDGLIRGSALVAVDAGTVLGTYPKKAGGISYIVIQHPKLKSMGTVGYTVYMHCWPILVKKGDVVKEGQRIAYESDQGSPGSPHLHFEIHDANKHVVDPLLHLDTSSGNLQKSKSLLLQNKKSLEALPGGAYAKALAGKNSPNVVALYNVPGA